VSVFYQNGERAGGRHFEGNKGRVRLPRRKQKEKKKKKFLFDNFHAGEEGGVFDSIVFKRRGRECTPTEKNHGKKGKEGDTIPPLWSVVKREAEAAGLEEEVGKGGAGRLRGREKRGREPSFFLSDKKGVCGLEKNKKSSPSFAEKEGKCYPLLPWGGRCPRRL